MATDNNIYFIAEAGVNHDGSLTIAKQLVDIAVAAFADAVKFQIYNSEELIKPESAAPDYMEEQVSMQDILKRYELSQGEWVELIEYCRLKEIDFLCTPFDIDSAKFLYTQGVSKFKISSGDFENIILMEKIFSLGDDVNLIISSGMSNLKTAELVVETLTNSLGIAANKICLMHCVSSYPTPDDSANLMAIRTLRKVAPVEIGYSDHTLGTLAPSLAVALGAKVIEKHFTYDKEAVGPDHKMSINPNELAECISLVRQSTKMMGDGLKNIQDVEESLVEVARRGAYWKMDYDNRSKFSFDMVDFKRPFNGVSYFELKRVINSLLASPVKKGEGIRLSNFE
tara:strand:+ start:4270 stop:5292 length:1023 start_codon:yes stop_codon:yes gene_type:complete